jgi:large subunit ribosomal protein L30e
MTFESEIKKVLKDGELMIGEKSVKKAVLTGKAKMVIVASSASDSIKDDMKRYAALSKIKYYIYPESSKELGYACGKPFPVSVIGIIKEGSSRITQLK